MEQSVSPEAPVEKDKVDMGKGSLEDSFNRGENTPPNVQGPRKVPIPKQRPVKPARRENAPRAQ